MSSLDDELEAAADRIANMGVEGHRDLEVKALTASPSGVPLRVAGVALAMAGAVALFYIVSAVLGLQGLRGLCQAVGVCG